MPGSKLHDCRMMHRARCRWGRLSLEDRAVLECMFDHGIANPHLVGAIEQAPFGLAALCCRAGISGLVIATTFCTTPVRRSGFSTFGSMRVKATRSPRDHCVSPARNLAD